MRELWRFVGGFWGVFSHCEASGSQSFLFSCAFHSADAIMNTRALGGAFYTQLPRLSENALPDRCTLPIETVVLLLMHINVHRYMYAVDSQGFSTLVLLYFLSVFVCCVLCMYKGA